MSDDPYYEITEAAKKKIRAEREKARSLRKTQWWQNLVQKGVCYYCNKKFPAGQLTMDHVVPLARGGKSTKGNLVVSCRSCNELKRLDTPVDQILRDLNTQKKNEKSDSDGSEE
jgi:5-methylcytosine-specific restriction enzyme A